MLTAQHPTSIDGCFNDCSAGCMDTFIDAWFFAIEQQQRVQIAITGVEHVEHLQIVLFDNRVDLVEHAGQRRKSANR